MGRRGLTAEDVRSLVLYSIELIVCTQNQLNLPICTNIETTYSKLSNGQFCAISLSKERDSQYRMVYGSFEPPDIISLDRDLLYCDLPLNIPEFPFTMAHYTAIHETIHADDHNGGDKNYLATMNHIIEEHRDKLEKSMEIISKDQNNDCINDVEDLACLWAIQFMDILTHYRSFVVLRHHQFPKLDLVWRQMQNDFFPPSMITKIEQEKNTQYIFDEIIGKAGEYCLIDALMENHSIGEKNACKYAI